MRAGIASDDSDDDEAEEIQPATPPEEIQSATPPEEIQPATPPQDCRRSSRKRKEQGATGVTPVGKKVCYLC